MKYVLRFLFHRNTQFSLAVIVGLLAPAGAETLRPLVLPLLAIVLAFSLTGITLKEFFPLRHLIRPILFGISASYLVLGTLIILLAWLFTPDKELFWGFVIIAAAPAGTGVIPFAFILRGDVAFAVFGVLGSYLASFILIPVMLMVFAPGVSVSPEIIGRILVILLIIPMVASRFLLMKTIQKPVFYLRGKVVNLGFALVIYTVIGSNQDVFLTDPMLLLPVAAVTFFATFGISLAADWALKRWAKKLNRPKQISGMLLASLKNNGFAIAVSLTLLPPRGGIPPAVMGMMMVPYLVYLSFRYREKPKGA